MAGSRNVITLPAETITSNRSAMPSEARSSIHQISCQPDRAGMIAFGCRDQLRVDVDTDHPMAERSEPAADPSRSTAGVENPRSTRNHGVDEPGLTIEILTLGRHRPEPFDVPRRMTGVLLDHSATSRCRSHRDRTETTIVGALAAPDATIASRGEMDDQSERTAFPEWDPLARHVLADQRSAYDEMRGTLSRRPQ